jgi:hypothetical protein
MRGISPPSTSATHVPRCASSGPSNEAWCHSFRQATRRHRRVYWMAVDGRRTAADGIGCARSAADDCWRRGHRRCCCEAAVQTRSWFSEMCLQISDNPTPKTRPSFPSNLSAAERCDSDTGRRAPGRRDQVVANSVPDTQPQKTASVFNHFQHRVISLSNFVDDPTHHLANRHSTP